MSHILLIVFSYLMGSIPSGVILAKIVRPEINLRDVGSGNIGATNVKRALGSKWGGVTLFFDALKGFIPVYLATRFGLSEGFICAAALTAFIGHLYPVWLKFKGGKGIATTLGVLLAFDLGLTFVVAIIWLSTSLISRTSAVGALAAAFALPIAAIGLRPTTAAVMFSVAINVMVFISHRENIKWIKDGVELPLKMETDDEE